jgi:hypothetical protein
VNTSVPWTDEQFLRGVCVVPDIAPLPAGIEPYDPRKDFEEAVVAKRLEERRKCIMAGRVILGSGTFTICAAIALWVLAAL